MAYDSMISVLLIIAATSLLGLSGGLVLLYFKTQIQKHAHYFQAFAVGAMGGVTIFHLLPESYELAGHDAAWLIALGLVIFFIVEKTFIINHCETHGIEYHEHKEARGGASVQLVQLGDSIHNFMDGVVMGTAFLTNPQLGIAVAISQIAHEIPQEMSDFAILIKAGLSRARIIALNVTSSLSSVLGALLVFALGATFSNITSLLLPVAAGGFMYLAFSHILPELHHETKWKKSIAQIALIILGFAVMWALHEIGE